PAAACGPELEHVKGIYRRIIPPVLDREIYRRNFELLTDVLDGAGIECGGWTASAIGDDGQSEWPRRIETLSVERSSPRLAAPRPAAPGASPTRLRGVPITPLPGTSTGTAV